MTWRRVLPALLLLAAVATAFVVLRRTPVAPPPVEEPVWTVSPPPDAPAGAPFVLGRAPRPETVRWKGTFSYDQVPSGNFGAEPTKPRRALAGTFTAVEATSGPASARATGVDATFELEDRDPSAVSARRAFHARLSFTRDPAGGVVHRSIRLEAPAEVRTELELFQAAWAGRFSLPVPAVRVGQRIPIEDAIDVDDLLHRPLLFLFKERAAIGGPVNAPAEGGVWIASKTEDAGGGSVLLRVALTHAHAGENGPKGRGAVGIDYRARLEGERAFDLGDGRVTSHELSLARRMRYTAAGLDYVILVRSKIAMSEDGSAK